jgi:2,4-dienoyl-CoA reductase (NADPH2)
MSAFPNLLSPGRIGSMELRNRLVMSPMETLYGTADGLPSERTIAYFAARAAGGVGLITVGATGIDPLHPGTPASLQISSAAAVPAHRALVDAVHAHGAKIQPQIAHPGPDGWGFVGAGVASLGPSAVLSYLTGNPCEAVSSEQISAVLDLFKAAARRVAEAGYDGIELHAAHGYMFLGSFLSPQRNRRSDVYRGSTAEGRIQMVIDVLAAIRSEVGHQLPITLRISGYDRVAGGRPLDETARVAPLLAAAGVDAFHVSGGVIDRLVTQMVDGADEGDALNVGAAAAVKEVVDVPVIAAGRIHDPLRAENILADGRADFIAMGRPMLADPELPNKLIHGRAQRVRRCISCENCIDAMEQRLSVDCAVNPRAGKERELRATPTESAKHVVVIGAGPAGLEATRVAAARGHRVTLLERDRQLGGALIAASIVHPENQPFLDYLRGEISRSEVAVHTGQEVDADDVAALSPDSVVVATGANIVLPDLPGADHAHVHSGPGLRELLAGHAGSDGPVWQRVGARVLSGWGQALAQPAAVRTASKAWLPFGHRIAIIGGDLVAIQFAEFLAARSRLVTVLESGDMLAPEVGLKRRSEHLDRLDRLGVTVHTRVTVHRLVPGGVVFTPDGGIMRRLVVNDVIVAGSAQPDLTLYHRLVDRLPLADVQAIGDCTGLGLIRKAVEEGARIACTL